VEPSPSESPGFAILAPAVISSDQEEYRISFTPDGQTAYFARGSGFFPQTRQATIYESRLVDGEWSEPVVVSFSGTYPDIDPWVSPDGESIYFSSIRPVGGEPRSDAEVWRVDRAGEGWGEPVHLAAIGSTSDELGASVTADGVVWFASDRAGGSGGWDLYTAAPSADGLAAPEPVASFNTAAWEFNPAISADGSLLAFTSINREGGSGLGDLFLARQSAGGWSPEQPATINSGADEYHPSFSPDGATLYFVRRVANGDLYEAPLPPE
jgi:Tol biopolymer transport system component